MNKFPFILGVSAIIAAICASPAQALQVIDGTIANLNDGVVLDATAIAQSSAYEVNLSYSSYNNSTNSLGLSNPGVSGPGLVFPNDPGAGTVTLADLPLAPSDNSLFELHFNQNEPSSSSKISYTVHDVLLTVDNTIIWNFDEVAFGPIALNYSSPRTEGAKNNQSDFVLRFPTEFVLDRGFSAESELRIYWTDSDDDGGTPDYWALVAGSPISNFNSSQPVTNNPSVDVLAPAPLAIIGAGLIGLTMLRRRPSPAHI